MFDIRVLSDRSGEPSIRIGKGQIRIGVFEEVFEMSFEYWNPARYRRQWRDGVQLTVRQKLASCLLTSVTAPETANFVFCWALYPVGNLIVIQNKILFADERREGFDLDDPHRLIAARETVSEDGTKISEWQTTAEDLNEWLARSDYSR